MTRWRRSKQHWEKYTWRLPHIAASWCNFWIGKQVVFVLGMGSGAEDVGAWIVPLWLKEFCWRLAWIVSVAAASYYSIIAFNWHHITQISPLVPARGPALWPGLAPARAPAQAFTTANAGTYAKAVVCSFSSFLWWCCFDLCRLHAEWIAAKADANARGPHRSHDWFRWPWKSAGPQALLLPFRLGLLSFKNNNWRCACSFQVGGSTSSSSTFHASSRIAKIHWEILGTQTRTWD